MRIALLAGAALLAALPAHAQTRPEPAEPESAARHLAAAKALAGADMAAIADGYLCRSPANAVAYLLPIMQDKTVLPPRAAFDNLFYVGPKMVGAWVLKTKDGLILIDAMWNEKDAIDVIEPGIRALGLNPADIKHVVVTHGHVDHYGGARHFQAKYGAKVWSTATDWETIVADPHPLAKGVTPPARDQVAEDGGGLALGGETIRFVITPGHTPGTLSLVIPVKDKGVTRHVTMWGGTAMPEDLKGVRQMHASLLKLWQAGAAMGAEGEISSHPFVDDSLGRFDRRAGAASNPFALGQDGFARAMGIHSECILAQAARFEAWGR